jgi:hypothetical protein
MSLGAYARLCRVRRGRVRTLDWIRAVKWVVVAVVAVWLLHLFISWLGTAPM